MNADGSRVRQITRSTPLVHFPSFSSDGSRLIFNSSADGKRILKILDLTEGNTTRYLPGRFDVCHPALDEFPSWGPKGTRIAFESRRTATKQIFIIGSDGTGLKQLTFGDHNNCYPDWRQ